MNPRKTMISLLVQPRYKPNKVLNDPHYACMIALTKMMCKVGNFTIQLLQFKHFYQDTCGIERNTILVRNEVGIIPCDLSFLLTISFEVHFVLLLSWTYDNCELENCPMKLFGTYAVISWIVIGKLWTFSFCLRTCKDLNLREFDKC